jgi:tetratricopeptide (TPR) repeat protein
VSSAATNGVWNLRRVQDTLGLSRHTVSGLIAQQFVRPERGARNELRFTFQDLVLLRTAYELRRARIPPRDILQALSSLRDELPAALPLTGLRITSAGTSVVVRDAGLPRDAITGQLVLDFELIADEDGTLAVLQASSDQAAQHGAQVALEHMEQGEALEGQDRAAAMHAYRQAIALDPGLLPAYVSLGAMLCEDGKCAEAIALFDEALRSGVADAYLHFNHAIALEDTGQPVAAKASYRAALALDPDFGDAHFNLARLLQHEGDVRGALRHWSAYRRAERPER